MDISHLNKDDMVKLRNFTSQILQSLQTMTMERDNINDIVKLAATELGIDAKVFKRSVELKFKNKLNEEKKKVDDCIDLMDKIDSLE